MCTVTSFLGAGRLQVTMNRDEFRQRPPERPPAVRPASGGAPAWVAPADGKTGGTWMGANTRGVVACLLNAYDCGQEEASPEAEPRPSRGGIIPALLARGDHAVARAWLQNNLDSRPFAPFTLLVCSPDARELYAWRGQGALERLAWGDGWQQFSSSSWRTDEVLAWRRERFEAWVRAGAEHAGVLPAYHLLQPEGLAAWSPLMERPRSATRSITQVAVDASASQVVMRYWPHPGPQTSGLAPASELRLALEPS